MKLLEDVLSKCGSQQKLIWRLLLIGYCGFIVCMTLLNRPVTTSRCNLRLFWAFEELILGQPSGWKASVQYFNNILLFIPFGFLVSTLVQGDWKKVILSGMLLSMLIGIFQYVEAIGLAETDDVISNTLGAIVVFGVWRIWRIFLMKNQGIYEKYIKRIIDICCALAAILVFWWLYAVIAILVRVKLGSPVIFKQPRPGKDEKIFYLYKFRSMTDQRNEAGELLPDRIRLTKFGKALRSTSMDELPEAFNILKGDMSVIGPRPQLVRDMTFMTPEQRMRHSVRPGLSGLAQTCGRNALAWDDKLATDLEYIQNVTFLGDVKIVFDTVKQVFFKQKGQKDSSIDEIDITDDYGDYLLKKGKVTQEEYDQKQKKARELLGV